MKIKTLILVSLLFLTACAQVSVNPDTGTVSYTRWGDQQIEGLEITKDGKKIIVSIKKQQSDGEPLQDALSIIKALTIK